MESRPGIQPRASFWSSLDAASRHLFPAVLAVAVLVVLAAPWHLPGQAELQPAWVLASTFFWSVFRPRSMPAGFVFLLGCLLDLLAPSPLGVNVLVLLLVHGLAIRVRRSLARQGFALVWLVFVGIAAGAALMQWVLISFLEWQFLPTLPAVFQFLLAVGFYPALAMLLTLAHRGPAAPERA
jgi:rod shape-determining protein MreD